MTSEAIVKAQPAEPTVATAAAAAAAAAAAPSATVESIDVNGNLISSTMSSIKDGTAAGSQGEAPAAKPALQTGMQSRVLQESTTVARSEAEMLEEGVDTFYTKVMADRDLEPFFRRIDMQKQRMKLINFMIYVLGGADFYTGRDIWKVHKTMVERQGLRNFHFDRVMMIMHETLTEMGQAPEVISDAMDVIESTRPQFRFPPEESSSTAHADQPPSDGTVAAIGSAPVGPDPGTVAVAGPGAGAGTGAEPGHPTAAAGPVVGECQGARSALSGPMQGLSLGGMGGDWAGLPAPAPVLDAAAPPAAGAGAAAAAPSAAIIPASTTTTTSTTTSTPFSSSPAGGKTARGGGVDVEASSSGGAAWEGAA